MLAVIGVLATIVPMIVIFAYDGGSLVNTRQTRFCLYTTEGSSGIARLRYTQNLTIHLLSDTHFEMVYTAHTSEDLQNEKAELLLSSGLIRVSGPLIWEGDLKPESSVKLTATARIQENGKFRVRGTIGFRYADVPQTEHADLYVIVENGKITSVVLDGGQTALTPEQALEELRKP